MGITWWEQNWYEPGKHTVLDLGPCTNSDVATRAVVIGKLIGGRRGQFMEVDHLIVKVPPDRVAAVLEVFQQPSDASPMMMGCTHVWRAGEEGKR